MIRMGRARQCKSASPPTAYACILAVRHCAVRTDSGRWPTEILTAQVCYAPCRIASRRPALLPALLPPPGNEGPSRLRLTPSFACPLASCFLSLACGFHAQIALANLHKPTAPTSPSSPGLRILTRLHDSFALTQASTAGGHPMAGWPHTARVSSPATVSMAPSTLSSLSLACGSLACGYSNAHADCVPEPTTPVQRVARACAARAYAACASAARAYAARALVHHDVAPCRFRNM